MRTRNETAYSDKKAQIMEACYECYAENGLHGTGISALAEACGVSKAALYTYFDDLADRTLYVKGRGRLYGKSADRLARRYAVY